GVTNQQLADLFSDSWSATDNKLVVHPQCQVGVAVWAVMEARAEFGICVDEPALADDGLGGGDNAIKGFVIGSGGDAPAVEPFKPTVASMLGGEPLAQRAQAGRRGNEFIARLSADPP